MTATLLHQPSNILVQLLLDAGQVAAYDSLVNWPAWWEGMDDAPDNAVQISTTTGFVDGQEMVTGEMLEHHGIQVRVRSNNRTAGYAKISALRQYMHESVVRRVVTIGSSQYTVHALTKFGPILSLGYEVPGSKRVAFTVNGLMSVTRS